MTIWCSVHAGTTAKSPWERTWRSGLSEDDDDDDEVASEGGIRLSGGLERRRPVPEVAWIMASFFGGGGG